LAARAAVDLRDCGWSKEAEAIAEVLSELPTGLADGNRPEYMARQFDAIQAGAERIRTILTACLASSSDQAGKSDDAIVAQSPAATVEASKGVAPRNAFFVERYNTDGGTYHKPAKIREEWNAKPIAERTAICPDVPGNVSVATVEKAVHGRRKLTAKQARKPAQNRAET
jgi:hypothetical protein